MVVNPLAIDLGTAGVGWACADTKGRADVTPHRHFKMQETDRWAFMADGLVRVFTNLVEAHEPDCIVIERPWIHPKFPRPGMVLHVMLGALLVPCRRRGFLTDLVEPAVWQSWAKPRGWTKQEGKDDEDAFWLRSWWLTARAPRVTAP